MPLTKYYSCYNIKEEEMVCACDTYGDEEKCKENFVWKFEEKNILEDQEIDRCYRTSLGGFYCRPNSHRKLLCSALICVFHLTVDTIHFTSQNSKFSFCWITVPDFARVKKWPSCEQNDIIFVWYHAEEEDPNWRPTPIPQIQNGEVWYRGRNEFLVNSHIQVRTNGVTLLSVKALLEPSYT